MKVSIICASFNSVETIRQTIESVLKQDYDNLELVIADGGSSDGTLKIIEEYSKDIIFFSEKDNGIYDALNKAFLASSGDIIGTIGSDDFYPSNDVISSVVDHFKSSGSDTVYGDKQYVNFNNTSEIVRYWRGGSYKREKFLFGWMPPHLSFYAKRKLFNEYGLYNSDFSCSGDYELMLRMLYKHNVTSSYLPKVLITMRNGGKSTASISHRLVANKEDRFAWKLNHIKPYFFTLYFKPLRKLSQLFLIPSHEDSTDHTR